MSDCKSNLSRFLSCFDNLRLERRRRSLGSTFPQVYFDHPRLSTRHRRAAHTKKAINMLQLPYLSSTALVAALAAFSAKPAAALNLTLAQAYEGATFFDNFVYNVRSSPFSDSSGNVWEDTSVHQRHSIRTWLIAIGHTLPLHIQASVIDNTTQGNIQCVLSTSNSMMRVELTRIDLFIASCGVRIPIAQLSRQVRSNHSESDIHQFCWERNHQS